MRRASENVFATYDLTRGKKPITVESRDAEREMSSRNTTMKRTSSIACMACMVLLAGCAESTQDKMMRMAQQRSKIRQAERERVQQEAKAATTPGEVVAVADSSANPNVDSPAEARKAERVTSVKPVQSNKAVVTQPVNRQSTKSESTPSTSPNQRNQGPTTARRPPRSKARSEDDDLPPLVSVTEAPNSDETTMPSTRVAFANHGLQAAHLGESDSVGLYDVESTRLVRQIYNRELRPSSVAYSPQGSSIAIGGSEGHLKVFAIKPTASFDKFQQNRIMRRDALPPGKAHDYRVTAVAVDDAMGLAASGDAKGWIKLWRVNTTPPFHTTSELGPLDHLTSARTVRAIFGVSGNRLLHLLDTDDGVAQGPLHGVHIDSSITSESDTAESITALANSSSGNEVAIGSARGEVTIWSIDPDSEINKQSFVAHHGPISRIAFGSKAQSLVTISQSGDLARWRLPVPQRVGFKTAAPTRWTIASPDATLVGLSSQQTNLDIYSAADGKAVRRHNVRNGELTAADFSPSGAIVGLGTSDGRVVFQDSSKKTIAYTQCDTSRLVKLVRAPNNLARYAFVTANGVAGVADFPEGQSIPLGLRAEHAAVSPDGSTMIATVGSQMHFIALGESRILATSSLTKDKVSALAVSNNHAVLGTEGGSLWRWEFNSADSNPSMIAKKLHDSAVAAITIEATQRIVSADKNGRIAVTPNQTEQTELKSSLPGPVNQVSFAAVPNSIASANGTLLASVDGKVERYNAAYETPVTDTLEIDAAGSLAVDPTNHRIAVSDPSGELTIQNGDEQGTRQQLRLPITNLRSLLWSSDGTHCAATDGNRIVVVNAQSSAIESQCMLDSKAETLLHWAGDKIWYFDQKSALRQMQLPRIHWSSNLLGEGSGVAWSADGTLVAALTRDGKVFRWQAETGIDSARVETGLAEARSLVAIPGSQDFAFLYSSNNAAKLTEDARIEDLKIASSFGLRDLFFRDDGNALYAVNSMGALVSWNLDRLHTNPSDLRCEMDRAVATQLNSKHLVAASGNDKVAAIIPISQQSEISMAIGGPPSSIVLSGDAKVAGFADDGPTAKLFPLDGSPSRDLADGELQQHRLAINHDGGRAATLAGDGTGSRRLIVWDTTRAEPIAQCELPKDPIDLFYSHDGSHIAVEYRDGHCEVRDATSTERIESIPASNKLRKLVFAADDTGVVLADDQGNLSLHPLLSVDRVKAGQNAIVSLLLTEGASSWLIGGSRDGSVALWDPADLSTPRGKLEAISGPLSGCSLSPDRRQLSTFYEDEENTICLWSVENFEAGDDANQPSTTLHNPAGIRCAAFTADSKFLLVGSVDGSVYAWNIREGRLVATFSRHKGAVTAIQATDNPNVFVTAGEDNRVFTGELPTELPAAGRPIPREIMTETLAVDDLAPPAILLNENRDPFEAARQALVSGSSTADVLDLIVSDKDMIVDAKQILSNIQTLEKGDSTNARELSTLRRSLLKLQRRMARNADSRSMSSFADGFSNLTFAAETNFKFGIDREFRPVRLLFANHFLYAARTSAQLSKRRWRPGDPIADEGDNGALLSWDYRYSQLQAHAWSIDDISVRELFPLPNSAGVLAAPQMLLFDQDGSSHSLPEAASWAASRFPGGNRQFLAVGTEGLHRSESDIMKIFDVAALDREAVSPTSQYRGFEGVVTAMAFSNTSANIAFCVRERAVHRLFIADAETLQLKKIEEFNHDKPWIETDSKTRQTRRNTAAAPGVTSLAFSPDDRVLVAHGNYGESHKFSTWNLRWQQDGRLGSFRKSTKELESEGEPLIQESGSKSIWFVEDPRQRNDSDSGDKDQLRLSDSSQYRVLVRVKDGFMVVNLKSNREEQKIDFLPTQEKTPLYAITDDGRWLIMGDDNGLAYIWDTLKANRYCVTISDATEEAMRDPERRLHSISERPAHTGPIVGVALSEPDAGRDYPAYAATFGEENKLKVWELFPILDPQQGLRSMNQKQYPVSRKTR